MKRQTHIAALLIVAAFLSAGCTVNTDPGADAIIVNAQRVQSASLTVMEALWNIDDADRPLMRANFPEVHAFVEQSRRDFPGYYAKASGALAAYQLTKSPDSANDLGAALDQIESLARTARTYLIKINAAKV